MKGIRKYGKHYKLHQARAFSRICGTLSNRPMAKAIKLLEGQIYSIDSWNHRDYPLYHMGTCQLPIKFRFKHCNGNFHGNYPGNSSGRTKYLCKPNCETKQKGRVKYCNPDGSYGGRFVIYRISLLFIIGMLTPTAATQSTIVTPIALL